MEARFSLLSAISLALFAFYTGANAQSEIYDPHIGSLSTGDASGNTEVSFESTVMYDSARYEYRYSCEIKNTGVRPLLFQWEVLGRILQESNVAPSVLEFEPG